MTLLAKCWKRTSGYHKDIPTYRKSLLGFGSEQTQGSTVEVRHDIVNLHLSKRGNGRRPAGSNRPATITSYASYQNFILAEFPNHDISPRSVLKLYGMPYLLRSKAVEMMRYAVDLGFRSAGLQVHTQYELSGVIEPLQ